MPGDDIAVRLLLRGRRPFQTELDSAKRSVGELGAETRIANREMSNGGRMSRVFSAGVGGIKSVAKLALVGVAALGAGIAGLFLIAKKSSGTYKAVTGDVRSLQRITGGTAEAASVLRYQAQQTGIDATTLARSIGLFDKQIAGKTGPAMWKFVKGMGDIGIKLRDAHGNLLPFNTILGNVSEHFKAMKDGPTKAALAMSLFGRGGKQMLPFLDKGRSGLAALAKEAAKFGVVLHQSDIDAMAKSNKAHREFKAGMEGLQIQIGRYVLPIFTTFVTFLAGRMPGAIAWVRKAIDQVRWRIQPFLPMLHKFAATAVEVFVKILHAVGKFGGWLERFFAKHPHKAFMLLAAVLGGMLLGAIVAVGTAIWSATGPVVLVGAAIALLVLGVIYAYKHFKVFREIVDTVVKYVKKHWRNAFADAKKVVKEVVEFVRKHWKILGIIFLALTAPIILLVGVFVWAFFHFKGFRKVITEFVKYMLKELGRAVAWVKKEWPAIKEAIGHVIHAIRDIIRTGVNWIQRFWRTFGATIMRYAKSTWKNIQTIVKGAIDIVRGIIKFVIDLINGDWGKAWDDIKTIAYGVWELILGVVRQAGATLAGVFSGIMIIVKKVWDVAWGGFTSIISTVFGEVERIVGGVVNTIIGLIEAGVNLAIKAINLLITGYNSIPFVPNVKHLDYVHLGRVSWGQNTGGNTQQAAVAPPTRNGGDGGPINPPLGPPSPPGHAMTVRPPAPPRSAARTSSQHATAMAGAQVDIGGEVVVQVDGREVARASMRSLRAKAARR